MVALGMKAAGRGDARGSCSSSSSDKDHSSVSSRQVHVHSVNIPSLQIRDERNRRIPTIYTVNNLNTFHNDKLIELLLPRDFRHVTNYRAIIVNLQVKTRYDRH